MHSTALSYPVAGPHALPPLPTALGEARPAAPASDAWAREDDGHRSCDGLAVSLRLALDRVALPLARAAAVFVQREAWRPFGYARLSDHTRERFGRSSRWLSDLAGLGAALERLPRLEEALSGEDGGAPLGRVAAMLIGRIADQETLRDWIDAARRMTVRQLRQRVRAARAGVDGIASDAIEEPADAVIVKVEVPGAVAATFEETLELYRVVEGGEAPVSEFVEALVAESIAGGAAASGTGAETRGIRHGVPRGRIEEALARSTCGWSGLRRDLQRSQPAEMAMASLQALEDMAQRAGTGGPLDLDAQIRQLIALEDQLELRLGQILAHMADRGAWGRLRFDGAGHYAEERLGLSRTGARQRLRAARALRGLPRLREAYESGALGLEATLQIVRILERSRPDQQTQGLWIERARETTVKRLKDEARSFLRSRLVAPDHEPPRPLDDAAWHASLERRAGLARERAAAWTATLTHRSRTDVFLSFRLEADLAGAFVGCIEAARRRIEVESDSCRRLPAWMGLLAMLRGFLETWDTASGRHRSRDAIYERDGYRCMAPGCSSRRTLEDHHVLYRSRGGGHGDGNRICLCRFHHHRGEHGGLASCRGEAPLGITWRLGIGGMAVRYRNERRLS